MNKPRGVGFALVLLIVFVFSSALPISAAGGRIVVLTLDRVTLDELSSMNLPNLRRLMECSTIGLLSLRTVGKFNPGKIYCSIGAGGVVPAGFAVELAYDPDEPFGAIPAGQAFYNFTGIRPLKGPVHLGAGKLRREMEKEYSYRVGELGRLLHEGGLAAAVFGNADTTGLPGRAGASMVMDDRGRVDYGKVGPETLCSDPRFPSGKRTDYRRMLEYYSQVREKAALTLLISGDLERLESERQGMTEKAFNVSKRRALRRWDDFLGRLMAETRSSPAYLMVLVPAPPELLAKTGEQMTPFILNGPGFGPGLAYSLSTRLKGLVTPADLTATFLDLLGQPVPGTVDGRPIRSVSGGLAELRKAHRLWASNYQQRWPILFGYGYLMIGLCLAGFIGVVFCRRHWFLRWTRRLLLFLLNMPLAFLLVSLVNPDNALATAVLAVLFAAGATAAAAALFREEYKRLTVCSLATAGALIVDLLTGTRLLQYSMLGYSVMVGARFYGIGNEYMGVLLGSFLTGAAGCFDLSAGPRRKAFLYLMLGGMALVAVLIIHPGYGANVGGGISAVVGFGMALPLFSGRRVRLKHLLAVAGIVLLFLAGTGLLDYSFGRGNTHFGQSIKLIRAFGTSAALQIINRKWNMNMGMILATPWARLLIVFILALPLLFRRPPELLRRIFNRYPYFLCGLNASIGAAVAALLFNDSGVVAAATLMIYGGVSLFCLALDETYRETAELEGAKTVSGGMRLGDQGLSRHGEGRP